MVVTSEQFKNGDYDYWRAETFIKKMDAALKEDGISIEDAPENIRKEYAEAENIVKKRMAK